MKPQGHDIVASSSGVDLYQVCSNYVPGGKMTQPPLARFTWANIAEDMK